MDDRIIELPISYEAQVRLAEQYVQRKGIIELNNERLQRNAFLNLHVSLLAELNWETLMDVGIVEDEELFAKAFAILKEIIKSLMSRQLGLEHPLNHVMDVVGQTIEEK